MKHQSFIYTKDTLRIYWQHARVYRWRLFIVLFGVLISVGLDVFKPFLYKNLFNDLALGNHQNIAPLIHIVYLILLVTSLNWLVWRIITFVNNVFQPRVMSDLLNTCYRYIQDHSYSYFNNSFVGSMVTKVRRYQSSFENIADQFCFNMGRTFVQILFILIVLFLRYWLLGLVVLLWSLSYMLFAYFFTKYKLKYDILKSDQDTKTTAHLADTITNNLNIKLFAAKEKEVKIFEDHTQRQYELRKLTWDLGSYNEAFQSGSMAILEFIMIYLAVKYWQRGILTLGDFALIQSFVLQIFDRLWDLGKQIRTSYESLADANEMTEILLTPHEVVDGEDARPLAVTAGEIRFNNVSFSYNEGRDIFKRFNMTIEPGERVAFVGPSGGGKTTIVKLLLRFLDIQKGEILVDGQNIAQVTQNSLRENLSMVPQEPILFHRSLIDNIRYAKPQASRAEVIEAAKRAHCHEFISIFPEGYETLVGERGVKLSGGERQRVAIARAILKNAPVLILDEATSSLDSESEKLIQDALRTLIAGKTTIVIAHRLSTIMQMDRIIVIEHGKITEEGKHEELIKAKQGTYQKLWNIQAGGFA